MMNTSDCSKWRITPNVNPRTNRNIKIGGPTYLKIKKECNNSPTRRQPSVRTGPNICDEWKRNSLVNPRTNRSITMNGPVYKKLVDECGDARRPVGATGTRVTGTRATGPRVTGPRVIPKIDLKQKVFTRPNFGVMADICEDWKKDFTRDPTDGKKIVYDGFHFKTLAKKCKLAFENDDILGASNWLANRIEKERIIVKNIEKIDVAQWDMCMTGVNKSKFRAKLNDVVLLGFGTFGDVYRTKIGGTFVVIKEAYITKDDLNAMEKKVGLAKIKQESYPKEFKLSSLVRNLIKKNKCPNFLYVYDVAACNGCNLSNGIGKCYVTFMEPADDDMHMYNHESMGGVNVAISVLYQMLMALHAMHTNYGIIHNDIKADNFLIKRVKPGGYLTYNVKNSVYNKVFHVENTGMIILLTDFGISRSVHPDYNIMKYAGQRNFKVINSPIGLSLEPITCKRRFINSTTTVGNVSQVKWSDGTISTRNHMFNDSHLAKLLRPNIPVDIKDFVTFPAFEFHTDIIDVIHLFTGQRRMIVEGKHIGFKDVSTKLVSILRVLAPDEFNWQKNNVRYFVAAEMISSIHNLVSNMETNTSMLSGPIGTYETI